MPTRVHAPNGISIGSAGLAQLMVVQHTNTLSVAIGHVCACSRLLLLKILLLSAYGAQWWGQSVKMCWRWKRPTENQRMLLCSRLSKQCCLCLPMINMKFYFHHSLADLTLSDLTHLFKSNTCYRLFIFRFQSLQWKLIHTFDRKMSFSLIAVETEHKMQNQMQK